MNVCSLVVLGIKCRSCCRDDCSAC